MVLWVGDGAQQTVTDEDRVAIAGLVAFVAVEIVKELRPTMDEANASLERIGSRLLDVSNALPPDELQSLIDTFLRYLVGSEDSG